MNNFRRIFNLYTVQMGWAIALGLFVGGIINTFIPKTYVTKIMARKGHKKIINGVLMGFTMSVCSHGILAISIQLYKKGAAIPSLIAFLLASPWANLPFTIMLFAFFGTWGAIYIVTIAIIIALTTGYIFMFLDNKNLIEKNPNSMHLDKDFSIVKDIKDRLHQYNPSYKNIKQHIQDIKDGVITLSNMVLWWILLGIALASLAGAFIPAHAFQQYMGPSHGDVNYALTCYHTRSMR